MTKLVLTMAMSLDGYFAVHPVALGTGKRVFTGKTGLELIDAKTYRSGVIRARYRPTR
jgi:hypothetical protein